MYLEDRNPQRLPSWNCTTKPGAPFYYEWGERESSYLANR